MRFLLLCILSLCNLSLSIAQLSSSENEKAHRRYWFYRTRFINDFIKIGKEQGDCIVLSERNQKNGYNEQNENTAKVGPDQVDITNQYLMTLALEYKLLTRSNQKTDETIKEIYYLIYTLNRLDARADFFWTLNPGPATDEMNGYSEPSTYLNGFMLREDMPRAYFAINDTRHNYEHFNYAITEYNYNPLNSNLGYSGVSKVCSLDYDNKFNNYMGFDPNPPSNQFSKTKSDLSMTHDKYYSMFAAFMFIDKYIPSGTGYYENGQLQHFQDGEWDIKEEVKNIANRCHTYLRGNTFGNNASDWIMEYPNGSSLSQLGQPTPYSYPLVNIICHINGSYPWSVPCLGYADLLSLNPGIASYYALSNGTQYLSQDGAVFLAYCHAASNVKPGVLPIGVQMDYNTSFHSIEWFDLMRRVLHQNNVLMKQESVYSTPMSKAPCAGPYNFGGGDQPDYEWSSQDRNEHPDARGDNTPAFPGNYPGVDYMLLHNLYYEHLNQKDDASNTVISGRYKNAVNLMDNYDEQNWPQFKVSAAPGAPSWYIIGVANNGPHYYPANVKVFQNLSSRAWIHGYFNGMPSVVEYRAGKDITLLPEDPITNNPGFQVDAGSDFHAYIQRYLCSNGDYGAGLRSTRDSTQTNDDYETDDMNTEVAIHYIDHPLSDSDLYPGDTPEPEGESEESRNAALNYFAEQYTKAQTEGNNKLQAQLENEAGKKRFVILPNPNNGVFKIFANAASADETFNIEIFDMKGAQLLRYNTLKNNVTLDIDLTQYSKGIYMVNMSSSLGYKNSKKVSVD